MNSTAIPRIALAASAMAAAVNAQGHQTTSGDVFIRHEVEHFVSTFQVNRPRPDLLVRGSNALRAVTDEEALRAIESIAAEDPSDSAILRRHEALVVLLCANYSPPNEISYWEDYPEAAERLRAVVPRLPVLFIDDLPFWIDGLQGFATAPEDMERLTVKAPLDAYMEWARAGIKESTPLCPPNDPLAAVAAFFESDRWRALAERIESSHGKNALVAELRIQGLRMLGATLDAELPHPFQTAEDREAYGRGLSERLWKEGVRAQLLAPAHWDPIAQAYRRDRRSMLSDVGVESVPVVLQGDVGPSTTEPRRASVLLGFPDGVSFEYALDDVRLVAVRHGGFVGELDGEFFPLGRAVAHPAQVAGLSRFDVAEQRFVETFVRDVRGPSFIEAPGEPRTEPVIVYDLLDSSGARLARVEEALRTFSFDGGFGFVRQFRVELDDVERSVKLVQSLPTRFDERHQSVIVSGPPSPRDWSLEAGGRSWRSFYAEPLGGASFFSVSRPPGIRGRGNGEWLEIVESPVTLEVAVAFAEEWTEDSPERAREAMRARF